MDVGKRLTAVDSSLWQPQSSGHAGSVAVGHLRPVVDWTAASAERRFSLKTTFKIRASERNKLSWRCGWQGPTRPCKGSVAVVLHDNGRMEGASLNEEPWPVQVPLPHSCCKVVNTWPLKG